MDKVGYLGPQGTFSEEAAQQFFTSAAQLLPLLSIAAVYEALCYGDVEAAVLPMENSIEGAVNQTIDELIEHPGLMITGELILPIHHHLLVAPGQDWQQVEKVYSHPQALAQCRKFLLNQLPQAQAVPAGSTAEGAAKVARGAQDGAAVAAIATAFAAERYGLQAVQQDVQDRPNNKTRFWVIGRQWAAPTGDDKTSLVCALPSDQPGGLYGILGEFARRNINLTRIESRPTKRELGQYLFFIDCVGHHCDPVLAEALQAIAQFAILTRVLGSYRQDREVRS
ncbi:prephenate dehydratase [Heliophilum fasciatum]|uniref:Prephenate dehydratase n=1 Tax=Heliophilum fasciatum TaxID=35700 RepID=A0A4R2RJ32_9FIRM|nr:prephenate dehydratase [Heliophilum fasciatum]MCW2278306.1 prephenate dehydratase [Heliophilum fasciatum]TCP63820.1 prephenate dehydratase [Heliophilum fasciatum]